MGLQVLVSTMGQYDYSLIDKMNIQSDVVVINQSDENAEHILEKDGKNIKWISSTQRGLSRSRNMALENSKSEICLLADDDLEYLMDYEKTILSQFELYEEADIIAFQVEGIEGSFKQYSNKSYNVNYLTSMKISSVEVAFRLDSIKKNGLNFNELFGAGSKYFMGEENIFLMNCLKCGLKIRYVPIKIANLHIGQSTWFKGFNKEYLLNRGAAFTAMSQRLSLFFIIQFAIRKIDLFDNEITKCQAVKYMLEGKREYLKDKRKMHSNFIQT
ncbi:glycosyltransferase [Paenibacillus sp. FSL R5-0887]|uniref:glycosyltransferase n=1 Tax=Paenibacillus sp. FSL R5-0887 TaxID=2921662 RepID=UPI0030F98389